MSIYAIIGFLGFFGLFFLIEWLLDKLTTKRIRTEEEQKFVDWYEFTEDYGFHKDLTPADHKRYNWIVKHTVWKPFNR